MLGFSGARRTAALLLLVVPLLITVGCSDEVTVEFTAGCTDCADPELIFELSAAQLTLPDELRDDSGQDPVVREVPCGPMGTCPTSSESSVQLTCEQDVCDPAPLTIDVPVGDVIDFTDLSAELRELFTDVESIEILEVQYAVLQNTLTVDVGEVEVFWAPAGATAIDPSMGAVAFGTVPPLAATEVRSGMMVIDPAGQQALSDHLVATSRVRFFARSEADIDPLDLWPQGSLRITVALRVRATGSTL